VPVSSQANPRPRSISDDLALVQVDVVQVGDLQLAAGAGLQVGGVGDDIIVVHVQAGDGQVGFRLRRLLLDRNQPTAGVTLADAVPLRVPHRVAEQHTPVDAGGRRLQGLRETLAVEDVVAQHQGDRVVADVVGADDERPRQTVRRGLLGVGDRQTPLAAVTEQPAEAGAVLRGGDHQDLPDPGQHQHRQRVVDHRLCRTPAAAAWTPRG
jgi:hypothetical protein